MKLVPYNHKAHEPRAQFCNTCHHHSLEKCSNCHTPQGDPKKGGGVTFERAFHKATAQQACVGCHDTAKARHRNARGVIKVDSATEAPKSSCHVCHRGSVRGQARGCGPCFARFRQGQGPGEAADQDSLRRNSNPPTFPIRRSCKTHDRFRMRVLWRRCSMRA